MFFLVFVSFQSSWEHCPWTRMAQGLYERIAGGAEADKKKAKHPAPSTQ
jgi:hypothetical protein